MNGLLRNENIVSVAAADATIAGPNERRRAIVIGAPPTNTIWVRFGQPAASGIGLPIYAAGPPLVLTAEWVGTAIKEEIHCFGNAVAQNVYVLDIFGP